jgi:hypothetical protein
MIPRGDDVCRVLERGQRVRHRHGAIARRKEGVIVLGVADTDAVVRGQAQRLERRLKAALLVDARGQDHHGALVERHLQLQAELADRLQGHRFERLPGGDHGTPDRDRPNSPALEQIDELG